MENQNSTPEKHLDDYGDGAKPKRSLWKFATVFVTIIVVGTAAYGALQWYLLRGERQRAEDLQKAYEKAISIYRDDPYGGKTPQETIDMFVKALEAGDVDLASKYFMPSDRQEDWGSVEKWRKMLDENKKAGVFPKLIDALKRSKLNKESIDPNYFASFSTYDAKGNSEINVELAFDGKFWKITGLY